MMGVVPDYGPASGLPYTSHAEGQVTCLRRDLAAVPGSIVLASACPPDSLPPARICGSEGNSGTTDDLFCLGLHLRRI